MKTYLTLFAALLMVLCGPTLLLAAQSVATTTRATAETVASATAMGQQSFASLLLSFFLPRLLEALKRWEKFSWIKEGAARTNRFVAIAVSVAQGSGLTWVYHRASEAAGNQGDGWQFVLGSKHSSAEEWLLACLVSFAAQQYFYEQMPAVQADSMAAALSRALKTQPITKKKGGKK